MSKLDLKMIAKVKSDLSAILRGKDDNAAAQRGAAFAFAIRVASAGIAFLSQILLARWMGVFEYGVFVSAWIVVLMLGAISTLGMNTSVLRFIPQYRESREHGLARGFLRGSFVITLIFSTCLALLGAGLVVLFEDTLGNHYFIPIVLALVCLPMFAVTDMQDGMARAHSWIDLALIPPYIVRPALLLGLLGCAVWMGAEPSAKVSMLAAIGATWTTAIVQIFVLRRRLHKTIEQVAPKYQYRKWMVVSLPIVLLDGFYLLLTYADILILNMFMTPRDVAIYFAAVKTTSLIEFVYFSVTAAASHKFSEYHAAGRMDDLRAFLKKTVGWTFWPSLLASLVILALGLPLLWLFGPEFTSGYPVMFILVVGLVVRASTGPIEALMNMLGQQNVCATVLFFATIINIALNLVLIPKFGLAGAASATTLSLIFVAASLFVMARRRLGMHAFIFGGTSSKLSTRATA